MGESKGNSMREFRVTSPVDAQHPLLSLLIRLAYFTVFFLLYASINEMRMASLESSTRKQSLLRSNDSEGLENASTVSSPLFESNVCPGLVGRSSEMSFDVYVYIMLVSTIIFLLFDLWDLIRGHFNGYTRNIKPSKDAVIDHWFFRLLQFVTYVGLLSMTPFALVDGNDWPPEYHVYTDVLFNVVPLQCSWSLLYFGLLLPSIGVTINSIQCMLKDMFHFFVLYLIFLIPFQQVFQYFMMQYSKTGCVDDFKSDSTTLFTLTLMMFGIVDPREYDVENVDIFRMLFLLYTFMCAIILLNFLIAIMTNTASKSTDENRLILELNRLSVACLIENRFSFCTMYYSRVRKLFFNTEVDGRICVVSTKNRFK